MACWVSYFCAPLYFRLGGELAIRKKRNVQELFPKVTRMIKRRDWNR